MTALLTLDGITVAYGKRRALDGVSLEVGDGEIVTLLGANGSGKSTTLRAVSGLVRPARGRIVYAGQEITAWPADRIVAAGITHVPEGREIFPAFTVRENLLVGGHVVPARLVPERLEQAFAVFPILRDRAAQPAGTLSGGEQQMLAIARALMARPRLLLLDEPSLGLAPMVAREIFRIVHRINRDGVTVLLVEQNARRALALATRGYVLETGRVVAAGGGAALAADPAVASAYLGRGSSPPLGRARVPPPERCLMSTNGPPGKPPAPAPNPDDQLRIAERRVMEEMARQRRAEERQLATFKYGCVGVIVVIVLFLVIGFMLS